MRIAVTSVAAATHTDPDRLLWPAVAPERVTLRSTVSSSPSSGKDLLVAVISSISAVVLGGSSMVSVPH